MPQAPPTVTHPLVRFVDTVIHWLEAAGFEHDVAVNLATDIAVISLATALISTIVWVIRSISVAIKMARARKHLTALMAKLVGNHGRLGRIAIALDTYITDVQNPEPVIYKSTFDELLRLITFIEKDNNTFDVMSQTYSPHLDNAHIDFVKNELATMRDIALSYASLETKIDVRTFGTDIRAISNITSNSITTWLRVEEKLALLVDRRPHLKSLATDIEERRRFSLIRRNMWAAIVAEAKKNAPDPTLMYPFRLEFIEEHREWASSYETLFSPRPSEGSTDIETTPAKSDLERVQAGSTPSDIAEKPTDKS